MSELKRRTFFKFGLFGAALAITKPSKATDILEERLLMRKSRPIVISTWNHGLAANKSAWEVI